jgi:hypothetical protein
MNTNQWSNPPHRFACAAVAMLASTLVLSSVLWLFASAGTSSAGASIAVAKQQPAGPGAHHAERRLATASTPMVKL